MGGTEKESWFILSAFFRFCVVSYSVHHYLFLRLHCHFPCLPFHILLLPLQYCSLICLAGLKWLFSMKELHLWSTMKQTACAANSSNHNLNHKCAAHKSNVDDCLCIWPRESLRRPRSHSRPQPDAHVFILTMDLCSVWITACPLWFLTFT